jgi:hypothetical protein
LFWVFGASTLLFIVFSCFANVNTVPEYVMIPELDGLEQQITTDSMGGRRLANVITDSSEKLLNSSGERVPTNNYNSINHSNSHYVELFKPNSIAAASAHTIREEADETLDAIGGVDLGLAISRIASIDQSMAGLIDVTSEGLPSSSVFKSAKVLTFLITTLLFGFVLSVIVNFLFLFLSQDLHMPASWIGWTGPTTGITELLCFCFSKQVSGSAPFFALSTKFLFLLFFMERSSRRYLV